MNNFFGGHLQPGDIAKTSWGNFVRVTEISDYGNTIHYVHLTDGTPHHTTWEQIHPVSALEAFSASLKTP
jgi:hypothetical protein